jgi:outer membrane protein assembly factor BamB
VAVSVTASPPALHLRWKAAVGGGPPIIAAGLVWTIGANGSLYGLNPSTGSVAQQASIGAPANHFSTPSVGDGLLLATTADHVVAFRALAAGATTTPTSAAAPTGPAVTVPATTVPATVPATAPKAASAGGGGLGAGGVAGIVAGAVIVLGGAGWLVWRSRRRRTGSTPAG